MPGGRLPVLPDRRAPAPQPASCAGAGLRRAGRSEGRASDSAARARREGGGRRRPALDAAELPEPAPLVPVDDFTVRLPGIGGTGVVTVSQVLGHRRHARRPLRLGSRPDRPVPEGGPGRVRPADQPGAAGGDQQGDRRQRRRLPGVRPAGGARPGQPGRRVPRPDRGGGVDISHADRRHGRRHPRRLPVDRLDAGRARCGHPGRPQPVPRRGGDRRGPLRRHDHRQHGRARRRLPARPAADLGGGDRAGHRPQRGRGRDQPAGVPLGPDAGQRPGPGPGRDGRPGCAGARAGRRRPGAHRRPRRGRAGPVAADPGARPRRLPGPEPSPPLRRRPSARWPRPSGASPGPRPRWPRPSPATSTSSWPTRTSTRWPGCTSTPPPGRGWSWRSAPTSRSATTCTRRCCGRWVSTRRCGSGPGSRPCCAASPAASGCAARRSIRSATRRSGGSSDASSGSTGASSSGWPNGSRPRTSSRRSRWRSCPTRCGATST